MKHYTALLTSTHASVCMFVSWHRIAFIVNNRIIDMNFQNPSMYAPLKLVFAYADTQICLLQTSKVFKSFAATNRTQACVL